MSLLVVNGTKKVKTGLDLLLWFIGLYNCANNSDVDIL